MSKLSVDGLILYSSITKSVSRTYLTLSRAQKCYVSSIAMSRQSGHDEDKRLLSEIEASDKVGGCMMTLAE